MSQAGDIRYSRDHAWPRIESADVGVVGITPFAQEQLGDIVYVELPEVGRIVGQGEGVAVIESIKTAADCIAPANGKVLEINASLNDDPTRVNTDPTGEGWFFKLKLSDPAQFGDLLEETAYAAGMQD